MIGERSAGGETTESRRALVYGDVNLNQIDGSAIWAPAVVQVLAEAGCHVTLLLKAPVDTPRLLQPLLDLPTVRIVRPFEEGLADPAVVRLLSVGHAAEIMRELDANQRFDIVVLRGSRVIPAVVRGGTFDGRIWTYLTDIPQTVTQVTPEAVEQLGSIARASRLVLCQTEELRAFLESTVPDVAGKAVLFPPVVPAVPDVQVREPLDGRPLRLVYSGKFAPRWKTEQMTRLPALLAERGVTAELHMIGDKIHHDPDDPGYQDRMLAALSSSPGVVWHGGRSREGAIEIAAGCDIGIGWRDRSLDASLELSTKVLEYGATGLPAILNRTPMHEALLGPDYPLFAADAAEVVEAIVEVAADPAAYRLAAERCRAAADDFTHTRGAERVRALLARIFPTAPHLGGRPRRLRVVVASHDLKFFSRLLDHLQALPEVEVRVDRWAALAQHDPEQSQELVDWADVVICEWCGPNALWYSQHKRPGQRLLVRLHRFELYGPWPGQIDIGAVDQVVCVSPHYARLTKETTGWPDAKIAVAPNWVDDEQLDRPKLPGARFHLGMIGVGESRKRFDLALDVLEEVRRHDERYLLFAKTKMPWDYGWIWRRPGEPEHIDQSLRRIQTAPRLRHAVVFDRFGPDIGTWLRRVGFILSTSDDESFHLAPAEGMASGAIPVIRNWPGADTIYDDRWIHEAVPDMAEAILGLDSLARWQAEGAVARAQVRASFALERVAAIWTGILTEDLPPWTESAPPGAVGRDGATDAIPA